MHSNEQTLIGLQALDSNPAPRLVASRCIAANIKSVVERTWHTPGKGYSVDYKVGQFVTRDRNQALRHINVESTRT